MGTTPICFPLFKLEIIKDVSVNRMYLKSDGGGIWDNTVVSDYTAKRVITLCRMIQRDDHKCIYTRADPPLLFNQALR